MRFRTENIEWNFTKGGNDHMSDEETLGMAYLWIDTGMLKRFKREAGLKDEATNRLLIPHYDLEQTIDATESNHQCYNSDTQIVLMHWLRKKQRRYKLSYQVQGVRYKSRCSTYSYRGELGDTRNRTRLVIVAVPCGPAGRILNCRKLI